MLVGALWWKCHDGLHQKQCKSIGLYTIDRGLAKGQNWAKITMLTLMNEIVRG